MLSNNNLIAANMINKCFCTKSYFRVLNAVKDSPALDVYINEVLLASNLRYGEFSKYMKFMPGSYKMKIFASGNREEPIFETNIEIGRNFAYNGAIAGEIDDVSNMCIYVVPDAKERVDMNGMASIRIINLIPNSQALDFVASDGTTLYSNLNYGDISGNLVLPAGTYDLQIKEKNKNNIILEAPNVDIAPKMYYTLFLVGEYGVDGESSKIELIIPQDGLNYLDLC